MSLYFSFLLTVGWFCTYYCFPNSSDMPTIFSVIPTVSLLYQQFPCYSYNFRNGTELFEQAMTLNTLTPHLLVEQVPICKILKTL